MNISRLRELIRAGVPHPFPYPEGGSSSSPPAPDYTGAAEKQSAASKEIATQQTWANRPDQYTPWGSNTWQSNATVDPATGQQVTNWTQQQQLRPELEKALQSQVGLQNYRSDLGQQFAGRVGEAYQQPFDWTNLPSSVTSGPQTNLDVSRQGNTTRTTNEPAFAQERQRIENSMFERMRPEQQFQEDRTRTMLANQGLTPGSEAYNRELQRLGDTQARERFNALELGGNEQARMQSMLLGQQQQAFGQEASARGAQNQALGQQFGYDTSAANFQNQLRQQGIAEQGMQRNMPLNEMNALLTGQQVAAPQMPGFSTAGAGQAPNYMGAASNQYQAGLDQFNVGQMQDQSTQQGVGQIAGLAAMYFL